MKTVRFLEADHIEQVNEWCDKWQMNHMPKGWLPTYGAIVPGIAAAWLYVSDSDVAWIENIISNPEASDDDRREATDLIVSELERIAKGCGTKYLLGSSTNRSVIDRAIADHGYKARPTFQLMKVL